MYIQENEQKTWLAKWRSLTRSLGKSIAHFGKTHLFLLFNLKFVSFFQRKKVLMPPITLQRTSARATQTATQS
ncbi:hypothetical protein DOY81_004795, partial [Sarcophaga bullata]